MIPPDIQNVIVLLLLLRALSEQNIFQYSTTKYLPPLHFLRYWESIVASYLQAEFDYK